MNLKTRQDTSTKFMISYTNSLIKHFHDIPLKLIETKLPTSSLHFNFFICVKSKFLIAYLSCLGSNKNTSMVKSQSAMTINRYEIEKQVGDEPYVAMFNSDALKDTREDSGQNL
ncbi:unnamed protein product [Heterobilharzia americana]|nr:unnamed protein product [Heterobilharzia americana]